MFLFSKKRVEGLSDNGYSVSVIDIKEQRDSSNFTIYVELSAVVPQCFMTTIILALTGLKWKTRAQIHKVNSVAATLRHMSILHVIGIRLPIGK